jgi:hypothetical protein
VRPAPSTPRRPPAQPRHPRSGRATRAEHTRRAQPAAAASAGAARPTRGRRRARWRRGSARPAPSLTARWARSQTPARPRCRARGASRRTWAGCGRRAGVVVQGRLALGPRAGGRPASALCSPGVSAPVREVGSAGDLLEARAEAGGGAAGVLHAQRPVGAGVGADLEVLEAARVGRQQRDAARGRRRRVVVVCGAGDWRPGRERARRRFSACLKWTTPSNMPSAERAASASAAASPTAAHIAAASATVAARQRCCGSSPGGCMAARQADEAAATSGASSRRARPSRAGRSSGTPRHAAPHCGDRFDEPAAIGAARARRPSFLGFQRQTCGAPLSSCAAAPLQLSWPAASGVLYRHLLASPATMLASSSSSRQCSSARAPRHPAAAASCVAAPQRRWHAAPPSRPQHEAAPTARPQPAFEWVSSPNGGSGRAGAHADDGRSTSRPRPPRR